MSSDGPEHALSLPTVDDLPADIRDLLETYSGVQSEDVIAHIVDVRDNAARILPYPMITQCRFLHLALSQQPGYPRILGQLKSQAPSSSTSTSATTSVTPTPTSTAQLTQPHRILDVGSGLGQDIRKLLHDGVPGSAITGLELDERFLPFGDALFCDHVDSSSSSATKDTHPRRGIEDVNFLIGDILSLSPSPPTLSPMPSLLGAFSIIHVASLLHLFPLLKQHALLAACVRLASPAPGTTILGWQIGSPSPMDYFDMTNFSLQYRHSMESFKEMWAEVGSETDTKWEVTVCEMSEGKETKWGEPAYWRLVWEVRRL